MSVECAYEPCVACANDREKRIVGETVAVWGWEIAGVGRVLSEEWNCDKVSDRVCELFAVLVGRTYTIQDVRCKQA
jgi:hypothetical protein